jgi:hypothetical protein
LCNDVHDKGDKGASNEAEGDPLTLEMDPSQLPDHYYRGKDLDERIQAKASQRHRSRCISCHEDQHDPDYIPPQGDVFKEQSSFQQSSRIHYILQL